MRKKIYQLALIGLLPAAAFAETVGFWQFEGKPIGKDSVGDHHLKEVGSVEHRFEQIAVMDSQAGLVADVPLPGTKSFAVEGYLSFEFTGEMDEGRAPVVGTYLPGDRGWEVYVQRNLKLALELATGKERGLYYVSNEPLEENTAYYFAVLVDGSSMWESGATVTLFIKNLQTEKVTRTVVTRAEQKYIRETDRAVFSIGGREDLPKEPRPYELRLDDIRLFKGLPDKTGLAEAL